MELSAKALVKKRRKGRGERGGEGGGREKQSNTRVRQEGLHTFLALHSLSVWATPHFGGQAFPHRSLAPRIQCCCLCEAFPGPPLSPNPVLQPQTDPPSGVLCPGLGPLGGQQMRSLRASPTRRRPLQVAPRESLRVWRTLRVSWVPAWAALTMQGLARPQRTQLGEVRLPGAGGGERTVLPARCPVRSARASSLQPSPRTSET